MIGKNNTNNSGYQILIDGEEIKENLNLNSQLQTIEYNNLPFKMYNTNSAVLIDNEIYIVSRANAFYKLNIKNGTWTNLSTLPYYNTFNCLKFFNNKLYLFGGDTSTTSKYHIWNGTSWTLIGTLPYISSGAEVIEYNNKLYMLSGNYSSQKFYVLNDSNWTSVGTLPTTDYNGIAFVYQNKIHYARGWDKNVSGEYHYVWNGSAWSTETAPKYYISSGMAILYNNKIYWFGRGYSSSDDNYIYYDENGWSVSDLTLPSGGYLQSASGVVVDYNLHSELYLFGSNSATYYKRCIIINRKFYTEGGILKK